MTYSQPAGKVTLPAGKKVAVGSARTLTPLCIRDGSFHRRTYAYRSRGEFDAEVATPRLLRLLDKHGVKADVVHSRPHRGHVHERMQGHRRTRP